AYGIALDPVAFAAIETTAKDLVAGRDKSLSIQLLRGAVVRGRVPLPSGAPFEGAKVEAQSMGFWFGFDNRTLRETKSGKNGDYELRAVTPGEINVVAEAQGYIKSEPVKLELR